MKDILLNIRNARNISFKNKNKLIEEATSKFEVSKIKKEYEALNTLYAEVSIVGKNAGNRETNDDEAIVVINKFKKNINFNIENELKRNPEYDSSLDLFELSIYDRFLPRQLSNEEVVEIIVNLSMKNGIEVKEFIQKSRGLIMKHLNDNFKGQFSGKEVNDILTGLSK